MPASRVLGLVPFVLSLGCHLLLPLAAPPDSGGDLPPPADLALDHMANDGGPTFGAVEAVPELNSP